MKKNNGWNYRIVAEIDPTGEYFYSIRDVYYKNDKPTSWGAEPQYAVGENPGEVSSDINLMSKAIYLPLLVVKGDKLIEGTKKSAMTDKAERIVPLTTL